MYVYGWNILRYAAFQANQRVIEMFQLTATLGLAQLFFAIHSTLPYNFILS